MNSDLQQQIIAACPLLYAHGMSFECGDGWFNLIKDLSIKIEAVLKECAEDECRGLPYAVQVKEKYGTLRFYMSHESDEMFAWIEGAEKLSSVTCEGCGEQGRICSGGWISTLCDKHASSYG